MIISFLYKGLKVDQSTKKHLLRSFSSNILCLLYLWWKIKFFIRLFLSWFFFLFFSCSSSHLFFGIYRDTISIWCMKPLQGEGSRPNICFFIVFGPVRSPYRPYGQEVDQSSKKIFFRYWLTDSKFTYEKSVNELFLDQTVILVVSRPNNWLLDKEFYIYMAFFHISL